MSPSELRMVRLLDLNHKQTGMGIFNLISLKHLNRPEIWREEDNLFQIRLPLTNGEAELLIVNIDGNKIQVLIDGEAME